MANVKDGTGNETPESVSVTGAEPIAVGGPAVGDQTMATSTGESAPQASADDMKNPLGEETIRVRARQGVEMYPQFTGGEKFVGGDEADAPLSMARAASMYLDQVMPDGTLRGVPHEQQQSGKVLRADLAGRPRHERIGALETEKKELEARLDEVTKRLDAETKAQDSEIAKRQQAQASGADKGVPVGSQSRSFPPGTSGAPGTQAVPPRPGEPGSGAAKPNVVVPPETR